jgi:SPP1 gp7 family putative phage head morphogenesis protein
VELEHFRSLLRDSDSYTAFRNAVLDAGYQFNNNWLQTEYNTANAATQSAAQWASYESEGVEVLEYSTVGDDRVRPAHQALDGFTALLSNPIWNLIYPPNDWNCRCWVVPGISDNIDGVKIDPDFLKDEIPKYFQRNWGKTKVLFDSDHPYFKNSYGDIKQWGAEEIYNMPSVSNLYKKFEYEAKIEFGSKEEANKWWSDEAGGQRKFFDVEDKKGLTIRFDNKFRNHVFEDNTDERYLIIANIKDIVQQPDEIWTVRNGDTLTRHYLKYYKDFPQIVSVENDGGMRAYTFHDFNKNGKLNKKEIEKVRRGQLVYRKN